MKFNIVGLVRTKRETGTFWVVPAKELVGKRIAARAFSKFKDETFLVLRFTYNTETHVRRISEGFLFDTRSVSSLSEVADLFREEFGTEVDDQEKAIQAYIAKSLPEAPAPPVVDLPLEPDEINKLIKEFVTSVSPDSMWTDSFFVQDEERNAFAMAKKLSGEKPVKVLIVGASGYGKTSLPRAFANANGMRYCRFNTALVRDPEEFFGWRTVEDGDVKFMHSEFTEAIVGGNAVVVLDELNRATPEMANALFPILDDDAQTMVFGEKIVVGPNVIIVATINVGYQFVGTFSIDQALINRMDITLRVSPLPAFIECEVLVRRAGVSKNQAETIVTICNKLRNLTNECKIIVDASTRTSIRVAKFVANGASFQDAFAWALVNGVDVEERKEVIDTISSVLK